MHQPTDPDPLEPHDEGAVICTDCHTGKQRANGTSYLICPNCDAPAPD